MRNSKSNKDKEKESKRNQDIRNMFMKKPGLSDSKHTENDQPKNEGKKVENKIESEKIELPARKRKIHELDDEETIGSKKLTKQPKIEGKIKEEKGQIKGTILSKKKQEESDHSDDRSRSKRNKSKRKDSNFSKNKSPKKKEDKNKKKTRGKKIQQSFEDDEDDSEYNLKDGAKQLSKNDSEDGSKNLKNKKETKGVQKFSTPKKEEKRKESTDMKIDSGKNQDNINKNSDEFDEEQMQIISMLIKEHEDEDEKKKNNNVKKNIEIEQKVKNKTEKNVKKNVIMDESLDDESYLSAKKQKHKNQKEKSEKKISSTYKKNSKNDVSQMDSSSNGPLTGLTFVMTGVLSMDREELSNILKGYGAKVTGSVSKKTNYLVAGEYLEDGRPGNTGNKYRKAEEVKTKIINFDELQDLIREKTNDPNLELENLDWKNSNPIEIIEAKIIDNSNRKLGFLKSDDGIKTITLNNGNKMDIEESQKNIMKEDKTHSETNNIHKTGLEDKENDLWTTKHTPQSVKDFIGNQSNIGKISEWLDNWNEVNIEGNKMEVEGKNSRFKNDNPNAKAMLISGDPGIGKTSSIRLLSKLKGYKLFELNASDQRNKKIILNKVGYLTTSTTLDSKKDEKINEKNLILMDEIDGMAGNEDRGGVAALIQIIKSTKVPIICICNDRQSQKLRSLSNYCYDIKFNKPDKRQVTKRLLEICHIEGLKVEENAIENLCESVGNDIRQCLNFLQFWSRKFKELKFFDMKNHFYKFNKDSMVMINHFEGVNKLLTRNTFSKMNFREKINMFFLDYDLVPLLIHENYLTCYSAKDPKAKSVETLEKIYKSANHISFSDIIDKRIRSNNDWNLLQDKGIHSSVAVGQYSANFLSFPKFPEFFGKLMTQKKVNRQLKELKYSFYGLSKFAIKEEICPLILSYISNSLINDGKDGVDICCEILRHYKISIERFKENIIDLQSKESIAKKYEKLNASIKTAFTKKYNSINKTSIKHRKTKIRGDTLVKYDEDGNILEEIMTDEDDDLGSAESIEVINAKGVKEKKK